MLTTIPIKETYNVLDDLTVEVDVLNNPYQFELEQLFQMATRINKKRSFLFVSKVLGKHLAVNPQIPLLVGSLLSMRYKELVYGIKDNRTKEVAEAIQTNKNIEEVLAAIKKEPIQLPAPTTFIGFAETATALGHAVFSAFANNAKYIHTTRDHVNEVASIINFEEEHSHATSHRVYAQELNFFNDDNEVVLVDDEVTTGKTAINIIRMIKSEYPIKKVFTVVSILDWRTPEYRERYRQLETELNITIHVVSLIDGVVSVTGEPKLESESTEQIQTAPVLQEISYIGVHEFLSPQTFKPVTSTNANGTKNQSTYLQATGRFGLTSEEDERFSREFEKVGKEMKKHRKGEKTLVVGTGEFMHIPMVIASHMGSDVYFQSTTRSPIYPSDRESYTIQNKYVFDSPENIGVTNHLYNIGENQYDEIFVLVERMSSENSSNTLISELKRTQIPFINIVTMNEITKLK